MAKKKTNRRKPRPLQIRIKPLSIPDGVTPQEYLTTIHEAARTAELPDGWEVQLSWWNPTTQKGRSKNWQSGEFGDVISDSSSGFATAVERAIEQQMEKQPAPRKRKQAPAKKAPAAKKAAKKQTKFESDVARSKAARKGWATRRAKAAAAPAGKKGGKKK